MALKNSNRKTGVSFERELCQILAGYGFWAHDLAQNAAGQPFDVLAAKDGRSVPIDCKVCENDVFKLARIEENQFSAMTLWRETGNGEGWFALKLSDGAIYMASLLMMETFSYTRSVLGRADILRYCKRLDQWVVEMKVCE